MSDDERAIRALVETWMQATRERDMATLRDLMTEDVVFMTPGAAPFGRDAFLSAGFGDATFEGRTEVIEIAVHGDAAFMRSHIEATITPREGAPMRLAGYAMGVLRKGSDGRWRLARDANLVAPVG